MSCDLDSSRGSNADYQDLKAIFLGPPLWFDETLTGYMCESYFLIFISGFVTFRRPKTFSASQDMSSNARTALTEKS